MSLTLTTAARNAGILAVVSLVDAGSGAGYIEIHTAAFATLLATLPFSDPAFLTPPVTGVATADTITDDSSADDTGTAAVFAVYDSDDTEIWRGTVGTSGEDINFNTVAIVAGAVVSISSWTITQPA